MLIGALITLAVLYTAGALFFGLIAYLATDPYGHFPEPGTKWKEALFDGALWLPILVWFFCSWFYYSFIRADPK